MTDEPRPVWRDAGETHYGVRVLDLLPVLGGLTSASKSAEVAQRAMSWAGTGDPGLDDRAVRAVPPVPCALRYPVAAIFPDGLVFTPRRMEDKWVILHRGGALIAARSWTGVVEAVARTHREGDVLVVDALHVSERSPIRGYGDPVQVFDWLVRRHALEQDLPLPAHDRAIAFLEQSPLTAFSDFGARIAVVAASWEPWEPPVPLRCDGALVVAVRHGDPDRVRALVAAGESVHAPTTWDGHTVLAIAVVRGDLATAQALLELGASPDARSDQGSAPIIEGIVHRAPLPVLDALVAAGASLAVVNADGFGVLHAAAESGNAAAVPWLVAHGADVAARTGRDHTALHIACGLGHVDAARALLEAGADPAAPSPNGTPREVAAASGNAELIALLAAGA